MKAIRIHEYGGPERLLLEEAPIPAIHDDQVLVRIHAAGVNPFDWARREGYMAASLPARFPLVLGMDCAGEVVRAAKNARRFETGSRVFGFANGAYAEFAAIREGRLALVPARLDFATAASLPTPGLTAYQVVTHAARVSEGQRVLVLGAAGAVGTLVVQLARSKGAAVVAVASERDGAYLESLGVTDRIGYETGWFDEEIDGVDVVVDLVGGETLQRSYAVVKPGGTVLSTADDPESVEGGRRDVHVVAFSMKPDGADLAELARLIERGVLRPKPARRMPLERAREAHRLYDPGRSHGKIVLEVD